MRTIMALAFICIMAVGGYMGGQYVGGDSPLWPQLLTVAGVLLAVIIIMVSRVHPV